MPAGLVPAICTISRVFSRQPVAIISALAFTVSRVPGLQYVSVLSADKLTTNDFRLTSMLLILLTVSMNRCAYSGPVRISLK